MFYKFQFEFLTWKRQYRELDKGHRIPKLNENLCISIEKKS